MRVRNADVNASDGFSALLFAHKTLERFCERKEFFPKRCRQTKTHKNTRRREANERSFPQMLYTSSVCFVRSVDPLRILFYGVYYVNPREQKKRRLVKTCKRKVLILIFGTLSARAYVYVYVTNASLSSHFNSPVSTARIDSRMLCTALSPLGVALTSSTA